MPGISPASRPRNIPAPEGGIQVNHCRTPGCSNFGVWPALVSSGAGRGFRRGDKYTVVGSGGVAAIRCADCGSGANLKSNSAVKAEFERLRRYLAPLSPVRCSTPSCKNATEVFATHEVEARFQRFGRTASGSHRWRCRACKATVSVGGPNRRQKRHHLNISAFRLLMNATGPSRMAEILGCGDGTVYDKIDFIHRQCRLFVAERERRLPEMTFDRLDICTDQQTYLVNWPTRRVRKQVLINGTASVECQSRYLFGPSLGHDPETTISEVEELRAAAGDDAKPEHMQTYAHYWTEARYLREAGQAGSGLTVDDQLPAQGVLIAGQYDLHGHFHFLRYLLGGAAHLNFFMDEDGSMPVACLGAFADRVTTRTADIFQVSIAKDLTIDQRRAKQHDAEQRFAVDKAAHPGLADWEVRRAVAETRVATARATSPLPHRKLQDVVIDLLFPDFAEPDKKVRFTTDMDDYDDAKVARRLLRATLWPVDSVFAQMRRRLRLVERGISSPRRGRAIWHINAPYNPIMLAKVLFIFSVWHNYVGPRGTKETPAMRLGLAKGPVRMEDILYFDVRDGLRPAL